MRQGKSWRGGRHRKEVAHPETFHRELADSTPARQRRSPSAGSECCMARGNARREAYTAGGKAPLMSLEILNDDAFIVVSVGAAPEAPPTARRHGSSGVEERRHSHGIARQETWETRHRPCGREPVGGATGMVTKPRPDARTCGASGARGATPRTAQGPHGTGRRTNKPKGRGVGGRSAPIVPLTLGNRGQRDPAEERRASHEQIH